MSGPDANPTGLATRQPTPRSGDFIARLLGAAGETVRPRLAPLFDPAPPRLRGDGPAEAGDVTPVAAVEPDRYGERHDAAVPVATSQPGPVAYSARPDPTPLAHEVRAPSTVEEPGAAGTPSSVPPAPPRLMRDEHPGTDAAPPVPVPPTASTPPATPARPAVPLTAAGPPPQSPDIGRAADLVVPASLPTRHLVRPAPSHPQPSDSSRTTATEPVDAPSVPARPTASQHHSTEGAFQALPPAPVPRRQRVPERTVHITIDRLEVRTQPAPAARPRPPERRPAMSLEEHLRRREGRRA